jgi:nicotinate-nucleotide adenylyltransferase
VQPPAGTCLYFGTFNPIHAGHLMIAQAALRQCGDALGFRGITFIPAGNPPHRQHEHDLLEARRRLRMVQLAVADNPAFDVSDIELRRAGRSYTIHTLRLLLESGCIRAPVPMIIGSDALAGLSGWHEPEALVQTVCFLQVPRPEYPMLDTIRLGGRAIPLNTRPVDMPPQALSSTWIRRLIREDAEAPRYFLSEPVRRYIADNRLYRQG